MFSCLLLEAYNENATVTATLNCRVFVIGFAGESDSGSVFVSSSSSSDRKAIVPLDRQ
jgi:hypothetical protein